MQSSAQQTLQNKPNSNGTPRATLSGMNSSKTTSKLYSLPLAKVRPNPDQPRKIFDAAKLRELADSIDENGLLQPIKVRAEVESGDYIIICGERRYRAHLLLGRETIEAVVVFGMSDDELADAAIVENLQRADISPLEEAKAYQARLDAGYTVEELAKKLGLKQAWRITERTSLLNLSDEMRVALESKIISNSQAYELSQLGKANQRVLFDAIKAGKCGSYKELRAVGAALKAAEAQTCMFAEEKTEEERKAEKRTVTRLESRIEALTKMCQDSFKDNELVALRKLNSAKFAVYQEQLELIENAVREMRLALRAAEVTATAEQVKLAI